MDANRRVDPSDSPRQLTHETLERLHRTTNELHTAESIEECATETVSAAIDILGFDWCVAVEADEDSGVFEIVAIDGDTGLEAGDRPIDTGEGVIGEVYEQGDPLIVDNVDEIESSKPLDSRIESAITVPVGDWGAFQALGTRAGAFDEADKQLLELLVKPLATTIERIQRETELRTQKETLAHQNSQIEAIHAVSTGMKVATEKEDIYDLFVEAVEQVLDIGICTLDECDGHVLKTRAVGSEMKLEDFYTETPLDQQDSVAVETFDRGETIVIDSLEETEYRSASSTYRSVISVPLGTWGIFQAATAERGAFDQTDRQLIELLADAAEAAIERVEREKELQRRTEKLEEQNEQLDQFASRLSHEMRNPLSVLNARLSLARDTNDPDHLDHMERSIHRMKRLIDDTLTLARGGTVDVAVEPVALDEVATTYWESIRTPHTALDITTDASILADEDRLHQLLSNLFRNAVEHTGRGVTVTVGDHSDGFYVEDDGPGIPPEDREAVLTTGTTGLSHGTGLGLPVVERIADAHGWSLILTESDDGGARFEFHGVTFD